MKKTLLNRIFKTGILMMLMIFSSHLFGQTVVIATSSPISLPNKSTITQGSKNYSLIPLKLIVSGKKPKNYINAKLVIIDYSGLGIVFANSNSTKLSIKLNKSYFKGSKDGDPVDTIVQIIYTIPSDKGNAYLSINSKSKPQYLALNFSKPQDNLKSITLNGKSDTTFTLDSIKQNSSNTYTVNLKFALAKGTAKEVPLEWSIKPDMPLQNLNLSTDDHIKIKIDSDDWNSKKDTIVIKQVSFTVMQTALSTTIQQLTIRVKGVEGRCKITLNPYKTKPKNNTGQLVPSGQAQIITQTKVGITRDYTSASSSSIDTVSVKVKFSGKFDPVHNQLTFAFIDSTLSKRFQIMDNPIKLTENEWLLGGGDASDSTKNAGNKNNSSKNNSIAPNKTPVTTKTSKDSSTDGKNQVNPPAPKASLDNKSLGLQIPLHIKSLSINDTLNSIQNLDMILKGQSQALRGSQRIKVSITDKPFWAEVGTNFALLDNIKTNNLYVGIYMFDKDIGRINQISWIDKLFGKKQDTTKDKSKNLSFTGGVYESQSIGTSSTSNAGIAYRDANNIYRIMGPVAANTSVKSVGLVISPHIRLTKGKTDANGLHIFLSYYEELLWQTVNSSFVYPNDSTIVSKGTRGLRDTIFYPYKQNGISYDFRSHYFGLGIPIYIKENEFNLYVNYVAGITNQGYYVSNSNVSSSLQNPNNPLNVNYLPELTFYNPKARWNGFYLVQYRLNEVAYGITFSGEIRGLMIRESKPVVTLALSKKFDLTGLFKATLPYSK
jgi:hypothetical protein